MHINAILAASTTEPPPIATTRSAPASLACFASPHHYLARGVLRDAIEGGGIAIAKRLADLFDLIGFGVEGTAGDQIDAPGVEALGLIRAAPQPRGFRR